MTDKALEDLADVMEKHDITFESIGDDIYHPIKLLLCNGEQEHIIGYDAGNHQGIRALSNEEK